MNSLKADLIMLFVTLCWGSSYLFMKMGLDSVQAFNLIALRFGLAFMLASIICARRLRQNMSLKLLLHSFTLGLLLLAVFLSIALGLKTTTTSNAGFLVSLTVVFVPLISAVIFRNKVRKRTGLSIIIAITGIAFLTLQLPLTMTRGDLLCIAAAFFYAIHIIVASFASRRFDTLSLGILQLGFTGLFGLILSILFETPTLPRTSAGWLAILMLSIFCSLGFVLQIMAQKYSSPARTGLIFSLEPVFAALFGFWFAQEILGVRGYIGALLVLLSIVLSLRQSEPIFQVSEGTKERNKERVMNASTSAPGSIPPAAR
ncbi:drug/metabolite transporter (DMT)-like permease [Paenibacillus forsythiae]|uniref:Drug/metabolite transporter (DMT)-like permease n=1 Tax=Paenibacillus forsythiae TaxID=365616 RepID=A0ABU3H3D7_9BACL|nr:DMT family transporter [Paenibacillus forsythiae]MDT3425332.1 drug/metabolite transporter (DMT)-like permease [Paenibacillus forsythiae]